jgi:transcriptional regulator with XRE-family HTH domain
MPRKTKKDIELAGVFGRALKFARTQRGYGLREFARRMGIHENHAHNIESGNINVTLYTIDRAAKALPCDPHLLLIDPKCSA